jgi:hypothetical protein
MLCGCYFYDSIERQAARMVFSRLDTLEYHYVVHWTLILDIRGGKGRKGCRRQQKVIKVESFKVIDCDWVGH